MNNEYLPQKIGFWPWLLQRLTAVLVIFTLFIHLWQQHFSSFGKIWFWESIAENLAEFSYLLLDGFLLAFVLFHALNGIRMIALDYTFFAKRERVVTITLIVFGIIIFIFGGQALFSLLIKT